MARRRRGRGKTIKGKSSLVSNDKKELNAEDDILAQKIESDGKHHEEAKIAENRSALVSPTRSTPTKKKTKEVASIQNLQGNENKSLFDNAELHEAFCGFSSDVSIEGSVQQRTILAYINDNKNLTESNEISDTSSTQRISGQKTDSPVRSEEVYQCKADVKDSDSSGDKEKNEESQQETSDKKVLQTNQEKINVKGNKKNWKSRKQSLEVAPASVRRSTRSKGIKQDDDNKRIQFSDVESDSGDILQKPLNKRRKIREVNDSERAVLDNQVNVSESNLEERISGVSANQLNDNKHIIQNSPRSLRSSTASASTLDKSLKESKEQSRCQPEVEKANYDQCIEKRENHKLLPPEEVAVETGTAEGTEITVVKSLSDETVKDVEQCLELADILKKEKIIDNSYPDSYDINKVFNDSDHEAEEELIYDEFDDHSGEEDHMKSESHVSGEAGDDQDEGKRVVSSSTALTPKKNKYDKNAMSCDKSGIVDAVKDAKQTESITKASSSISDSDTIDIQFSDHKLEKELNTDVVSMPTDKNDYDEKEFKKNFSFSGLSYIIGIRRMPKSSKEKANRLKFDCVLCNTNYYPYNETAMQLHGQSRAHVLNAMEIENDSMYKKYKYDKNISAEKLHSLLTEFENAQGTQNITIATTETFPKIREGIKDRIWKMKREIKDKKKQDNVKPKRTNTTIIEVGKPPRLRRSKFTRVIILADAVYKPFLKELTRVQVEVVTESGLSLPKLKKCIVERDQKVDTLFLFVTGIFNVVTSESNEICIQDLCNLSLDLLKPNDTLEQSILDAIRHITEDMVSTSKDIKRSLSNASDFLILPPIPAFIKDASSLSHSELHKDVEKIPEFYIACEEDLAHIKVIYDMFSKLVVEATLQQCSLPTNTIKDYACNVDTTVEEQHKPTDVRGSLYDTWKAAILTFLSDIVVPKEPVKNEQSKVENIGDGGDLVSSSIEILEQETKSKNCEYEIKDGCRVKVEKSSADKPKGCHAFDKLILIGSDEMLWFSRNLAKLHCSKLFPSQAVWKIKYPVNWKVLDEHCQKWQKLNSGKKILYVFITNIKMLAKSTDDISCKNLKCTETLKFMSLQPLHEAMVDFKQLVRRLSKLRAQNSELIITAPCPRTCIEKAVLADKTSHSLFHQAMNHDSYPLLLEGAKRKWILATEDLAEKCKAFSLSFLSPSVQRACKHVRKNYDILQWKLPNASSLHCTSESEELWANDLKGVMNELLKMATRQTSSGNSVAKVQTHHESKEEKVQKNDAPKSIDFTNSSSVLPVTNDSFPAFSNMMSQNPQMTYTYYNPVQQFNQPDAPRPDLQENMPHQFTQPWDQYGQPASYQFTQPGTYSGFPDHFAQPSEQFCHSFSYPPPPYERNSQCLSYNQEQANVLYQGPISKPDTLQTFDAVQPIRNVNSSNKDHNNVPPTALSNSSVEKNYVESSVVSKTGQSCSSSLTVSSAQRKGTTNKTTDKVTKKISNSLSQSSVRKDSTTADISQDALDFMSSLSTISASLNKVPSFKKVIFIGKKELIEQLAEINVESVTVAINLANIDDKLVRNILHKIGKFDKKTVCCLAFNLSIITEPKALADSCRNMNCKQPIPVTVLKSLKNKDCKEADVISNQLGSVAQLLKSLSKHLPVIVLPLYPSRIHCDTGKPSSSHKIGHALIGRDCYIVSGTSLMWENYFLALTLLWNNLLELNHKEYPSAAFITKYIENERKIFAIKEIVSEFFSHWSEPIVWLTFAEAVIHSLVVATSKSFVTARSLEPNSNISPHSLSSDSTKVSSSVNKNTTVFSTVKVWNLSNSIPDEFFNDFIRTVESKSALKRNSDHYILTFERTTTAELVAYKLNECQIGDTTLQAEITEKGVILPPTKVQETYITSLYNNIYSKWKTRICDSLKQNLSNVIDVTTMKTKLCPGNCGHKSTCSYYHNNSDRRRNPLQNNYSNKICTHPVAATGWCVHGDSCQDCLNIIEQMFYPTHFQTIVCPSNAAQMQCLRKHLCKFCHADTPEMLYTTLWEDLVVFGTQNTLSYFAGAIRGLAKVALSDMDYRVLLISPSSEFLSVAEEAVSGVTAAFRKNVFIIGTTAPKQLGNYQVFLSTPASLQSSQIQPFSAKIAGAVIVDDVKKIIDSDDRATLLNFIQKFKNAGNVNKVFVSSLYDSHLTGVLSRFFGLKLKEVKTQEIGETEQATSETLPSSSTVVQKSSIIESVQVSVQQQMEKVASPEHHAITHAQSSLGNHSSKNKTTNSSSEDNNRSRSHSRSRSRSKKPSKVRDLSRSHQDSVTKTSKSKKRSRSRTPSESGKYSKSRRSRSRQRSDLKRRSRSRKHSRSRKRSRSRNRSGSRKLSRSRIRSRSRSRKLSRSRKRSRSRSRKRSRSRSHSRSDKHLKSVSQSSSPSRSENNKSLESKFTKSSNQEKRDFVTHAHQPSSGKASVETLVMSLNASSLKKQTSEVPSEYEYQLPVRNVQSSDAAISHLRAMFGPLLFEEYRKAEIELHHKFEAEYKVFKDVSELHPDYETHYEKFFSMYKLRHAGKGEKHKETMWSHFWNLKFEEIKNHDWEKKKDKLVQEFKVKAPRQEEISEKGKADVDPNKFTVEGVLDILESLCDKMGMLGSALAAMIQSSRDLGINTKEALLVFTDSENVILLKMVADKLKYLKLSASKNMISIYQKANEWTLELIGFAKKGLSSDTAFDLHAVAKATVGKDSQFIVKVIRTALFDSGVKNPSNEEVNDLFLKVCSVHFNMAMGT